MLEEILVSGASNLGINLEDAQVVRFMRYLELLMEWNNKFNLTAIKQPDEIVIKHFLDSLLLGQYLLPADKLADIGSGAGFPGLPLKIAFPELQVTLVDSLNKRIKFLQIVVDELGLDNVKTVHSRAEDIGRKPGYRDSFDVVVTRAVARMSVICEYCLPLVRLGGKFIAAKGPNVTQEITEAQGVFKLLNSEVTNVFQTELPLKGDLRTFVIVNKLGSTPDAYPRKAGVPEKVPLEETLK